MQSLLVVVVGFVVGIVAAFLLIRPRVSKAEADAAVYRLKADEAEKSRQKLDVALAAVRAEANRVVEVAGVLKERDLTITDLERRCSSLSTSLNEREKALADEREQLGILKAELKAQFAELSANALKDNSATFLESAKKVLELQHKQADTDLEKRQEEIKQLVKPIQDGIKAVGDVAKEMEIKREKAFGMIEERIKQSVAQAAEVARQTGGRTPSRNRTCGGVGAKSN